MFPACHDILCLLVNLPADAVAIRTGCGDQKEKGLLSCVAGTMGHNVIQQSVGLGMQLIENNTVDIQAVLGVAFR